MNTTHYSFSLNSFPDHLLQAFGSKSSGRREFEISRDIFFSPFLMWRDCRTTRAVHFLNRTGQRNIVRLYVSVLWPGGDEEFGILAN